MLVNTFSQRGTLFPPDGTARQLTPHAWHLRLSGESGPGAGLIVGGDQALLFDPGATAAAAQALLARAERVTDVPVRLVALSHHHACHAGGSAALASRMPVLASRATASLLRERGEADLGSQATRFPESFQEKGPEAGPVQPARPSILFERELELDLGGVTVRLLHLGAGHTDGDTVAWMEQDGLCFAGDLVANGVAFDAGDARLEAWIGTLDRLEALRPSILVPGRGETVESADGCARAVGSMRDRLRRLREIAARGVQSGHSLRQVFAETCRAFEADRHLPLHDRLLPFSVARAYDEASGIRSPRIWTAQRDRELCGALCGIA